MKRPSGHRTHNYPKTKRLSQLADSYRLNERPTYESEPVDISEFGVGSMGPDYGNFNFSKPLRSDMVDSSRLRWMAAMARRTR